MLSSDLSCLLKEDGFLTSTRRDRSQATVSQASICRSRCTRSGAVAGSSISSCDLLRRPLFHACVQKVVDQADITFDGVALPFEQMGPDRPG